MSKERQILDDLAERKPSSWLGLPPASKTIVTDEMISFIEGLHFYAIKDDPMADLPADSAYPQRFLALHDGKVFYVNTEGYSYYRYVLRLPRKLEAHVLAEQEALSLPVSASTDTIYRQAVDILAFTAKIAALEEEVRTLKKQLGNKLMSCVNADMKKYSVSNLPDINLSLSTDDLRAGYRNQTDNE